MFFLIIVASQLARRIHIRIFSKVADLRFAACLGMKLLTEDPRGNKRWWIRLKPLLDLGTKLKGEDIKGVVWVARIIQLASRLFFSFC